MGKKIVLDTNVLVSAFGWKGSPNRVMQKCVEGVCQLYISTAIIQETKKVLCYEKFDFVQTEIDEFISLVLETAMLVEPEIVLDIIQNDPPDNRILECAVAADCDYIVSGDRHLLEIKRFGNIRIVKPENFLKELF